MYQQVLSVVLAVALAFAGLVNSAVAKQPVDLELALAIDVSSSIDEEEARMQRDGYVAAFRHPDIIHAIESGMLRRIAVTYYEWAGDGHLRVLSDWAVIEDADSANRFADRLAAAPLQIAPQTSISAAIEHALAQFRRNAFEGTRRVIDISGDGPNNGAREVTVARDRAVSEGVIINGLPIINGRADAEGNLPLPDLDQYYRDCVIGGPGAFTVVAHSFDEFGVAIRRKLISEIAGLTVPPGGSAAARPRIVPAAVLSRICDFGRLSWHEIWIN